MLFLLALLYILISLVMICTDILDIYKNKDICLLHFFRLSFSAFQGLIPAIMIIRIINGTYRHYIPVNKTELPLVILEMMLITVIEYFIVTVSYRNSKASLLYSVKNSQRTIEPNNVSLTIILLFAIISVYLWTRAFGSVFSFIQQADSVRASYSKVVNPFAFLEHFSKLFYFGFFLSIDNFCKKKINGIYESVLVVAYLMGSITVMLCTDSRGALGELIIIIAVYFIKVKSNEGKNIIPLLLKFGIALVLAFVLSSVAGSFFDYYRFKTEIVISKSNIFDTLEEELSFTFTSKLYALSSQSSKLFNCYFYNDFVNAILAWVPSRFTINFMPEKLWVFNSSIIGGSGTSPTDFITASIYMFGLPGVIILPALFGFALKKIDTALNRKNFNSSRIVYFAFFTYLCIWWAGYFGMYNTMLYLFAPLLAYMICRFINGKIKT